MLEKVSIMAVRDGSPRSDRRVLNWVALRHDEGRWQEFRTHCRVDAQIIDLATGAPIRTFRIDIAGLGDVVAGASAPRSSKVALLHVTHFREGGSETPTAAFHGVSELDLAIDAPPSVYLVSDLRGSARDLMKSAVPGAVAVTPEGQILLAPGAP